MVSKEVEISSWRSTARHFRYWVPYKPHRNTWPVAFGESVRMHEQTQHALGSVRSVLACAMHTPEQALCQSAGETFQRDVHRSKPKN